MEEDLREKEGCDGDVEWRDILRGNYIRSLIGWKNWGEEGGG